MAEEFSNVLSIPFVDSLSYGDQKQFANLREKVGSSENRYNRNKRIQTFQEMLNQIRQFCERDQDDDWKRYLACGITWLGNDIAINTRQLRLLINKSKSSINGAFAKMHYETVPTKGEDSSALVQKIPYLKGHFVEMRQWTIRRPLSDIKTDSKSFKKAENYIPTKESFSPQPKLPDFEPSYSWSVEESFRIDPFHDDSAVVYPDDLSQYDDNVNLNYFCDNYSYSWNNMDSPFDL